MTPEDFYLIIGEMYVQLRTKHNEVVETQDQLEKALTDNAGLSTANAELEAQLERTGHADTP